MHDTPLPVAVAVTYDGQAAPRVMAKGCGATAEQILDLAHKHGVPLHPDTELVALLSRVPLGEEIPQALFVAVAQVLAFTYRLSGKPPPGNSRGQTP